MNFKIETFAQSISS